MDPNVIWASIFGTAFLVTILALAVAVPRPTAFQLFVFRTVLSLSAGGTASAIPGFLSIDTNLPGVVIRAGGAIAVFVIVYRLNPALLVQPEIEEQISISPKKRQIYEGYKLLQDGKMDAAEKKFSEASIRLPTSPEPWYWKARIALERQNRLVAIEYIDKALGLDPKHIHGVALKVKLLLLSGGNSIIRAQELTHQSYGIADSLDQWLNCLKREDVFSSQFTTELELDTKCSFPQYDWQEG